MRLPKTVILENERLLIVYNATMYLLVGLVLVAFIWNKSWSVVLDASDSLGFSLWVGNFTEIGQIASHINDELPPLCKSTSRYNFWLHRVGETVKYDDFHCAPMCSRADMNEGCIRLDQLMQVQQDSVFFLRLGQKHPGGRQASQGTMKLKTNICSFPLRSTSVLAWTIVSL